MCNICVKYVFISYYFELLRLNNLDPVGAFVRVCVRVCVCVQEKHAQLTEDWSVILELMRQHRERMALLAARKSRKTRLSASVSSCLCRFSRCIMGRQYFFL